MDLSPVSSHLDEIRRRLIFCLISLILGFIISVFIADYVLKLIVLTASNINFIYVDITEMFSVYMQVCLIMSLIIASPVWLYQIMSFVFPALTSKEKGYLWFLLPCTVLFFIGGVVFGYYVLIPPSIQFLTGFGKDIATPQIRIGNYVSMITSLLMMIGLIFEIPVLSVLLTKMRVLSSKWTLKQWRWAIVGSFVVGAIVTPTWDPVNQTLVSVPIFFLYLLSILFSMSVERLSLERLK